MSEQDLDVKQIPFFIDGQDPNAQAWDVCWLGDILMPGIASLTVEDSYDFDVGKSPGEDGAAATTYKGRKPRKMSLKLKLRTSEQFYSWFSVRKKINAFGAGKDMIPYAVGHPNAQFAGIKSAYVESIKQPMPTGDKEWVIEISLLEYSKPKPAKPSTNTKNPDKGNEGEAEQIKKLMEDIKKANAA